MYVCMYARMFTASELRGKHVVFLCTIHVQIDVRNARLIHNFNHDLMYVCNIHSKLTSYIHTVHTYTIYLT